ncbi:MAG: ion transporter, partial [bacterium]
MGPIYNNNLNWVPFLFVAFISIGSFFCINLFIAIVSMKFNEA